MNSGTVSQAYVGFCLVNLENRIGSQSAKSHESEQKDRKVMARRKSTGKIQRKRGNK